MEHQPLIVNTVGGNAQSFHWYHSIGDFVNIFKAFIGTNYQALPFAFSQSGLILGIIGVVMIATLTDHCIQLLIKSKRRLVNKLCEEEMTSTHMNVSDMGAYKQKLEKTVGYGDIGRHVFGPCGYHLVQLAVFFTQYITCIQYFIFIGNTVYGMSPSHPAQNLTNITARHSMYSMEYAVPMLALHHLEPLAPTGIQPFYSDNSDVYSSWQDSVFDFQNISTKATFAPANITTNTPYVTTASPANMTTTTADTNITTTAVPAASVGTYLWDLRLLVLIPLPFFLFTSLIRKMRLIAPLSSIAVIALAIGATAILAFILIGFSICSKPDCYDYDFAKLTTLPIFIGQMTSAFEGIGCVVPIESSMEGTRHKFTLFLHMAIGLVALILCTYGITGYLRYGNGVDQLIVEAIPQGSIIARCVDVTLIISVLFTFPLQCFPAIEIAESYIFRSKCCGHHQPRLEYDEIGSGPLVQNPEEQGLLASVESTVSQASIVIPSTVPAWKRNIVRILMVLSMCGLAVLTRNAYAYVSAFMGAVGCTLLAFILPCMIHINVYSRTRDRPLRTWVVGKDIAIICLAIAASVLTLAVIVYQSLVGAKIVRG